MTRIDSFSPQFTLPLLFAALAGALLLTGCANSKVRPEGAAKVLLEDGVSFAPGDEPMRKPDNHLGEPPKPSGPVRFGMDIGN